MGAFSNLTLEAVVKGLESVGTPPIIIQWYTDYLYHRTATATVKGFTLVFLLMQGMPQGGVLSFLLWNLAFDAFLNLF